MSILSDILEHNVTFVQQRAYEPFRTDRFPDKKLVVLTCMDTRLVELLPHAMNIRNGDAKVIKNAGAIVSHPFGSVMRSILVAVYELMAAEVAVVGHTDTMGTRQANVALGMRRALMVRDLLVNAGLARAMIEVGSHGEADLLVHTPDETPEPRNRRVDIIVR